MSKRNIYTLGETVYDLIFENGKVTSSVPGGATLNSSVSLGRLHQPVFFVGEFGCDLLGNEVDRFLQQNGVDTRYVYRYSEGATSIAIAFLDEKRNASYNFYKQPPSLRMQGEHPPFSAGDVTLFGSFFSISPQLRSYVVPFVQLARNAGALVVYDPNFRMAHKGELETIRPLLLENFSMANLVRGSDEDFFHIFGARNADEAAAALAPFCNCLVYTASSKGIEVRTPAFSGSFSARAIAPVSTVGAGDTFNAGIIWALLALGVYRDSLGTLNENHWAQIVAAATEMASAVCMSYENYVPEGFQLSLNQ